MQSEKPERFLYVFSSIVFFVPTLFVLWNFQDLLVRAILIGAIAGFTLTIFLPAIWFVRRQRTHQGSISDAGNGASSTTVRAVSRSRIYALLAAVTLVSVFFQATHLETFGRLFGHSIASVFIWNFGILGAVLAISEMSRIWNNSK